LESSEDEEEQITEIRFVPEDKQSLNSLFLAMNECQALYPDEQSDSEQGEDEEEGEFYDEANIELSGQGQQILDRIAFNTRSNGDGEDLQTNGNHYHPEQFEDAD
jgi:hypothetical protein